MAPKRYIIFTIALMLLLAGIIASTTNDNSVDNRIISYIADPQNQNIGFYWKDDHDSIIRSLGNLKNYVETKGQKLVFAVNGGMYNPAFEPQGLYIQNYKMIVPLDTNKGKGNFYMMPNGVFYITADNKAVICKTDDFRNNGNIKHATQSGPMLVIDGEIHPAFKKGSSNLQIRNGVGILPDGKLLFAMTKNKENFYDFASYFESKGCVNALYFDGFVSRTYLPEKSWIQTDGNLSVMIGIVVF